MFLKLDNFLKDLTIRNRLIIGCSLFMFAFFISSSIALVSLSKSNEALKKIVYISNVKAIFLNDIKDAVYNIDLDYCTIIATDDKFLIQEKLEAIAKNSKKLSEKFAKFESIPKTTESQIFVDYIKINTEKLITIDETLNDVIQKENKVAAKILFTRGLHPVTLEMVDKINRFLSIEESINQAESLRITSLNSKIFYFIILLNLFLLIITFYVSYCFIKSIVNPIQLAIDTTRQISKGNLKQNISITRNDETGFLLRFIKAMQDSLREIIKSIRISSDESSKTAEEFLLVSSNFIVTAKEQKSTAEVVTQLAGNVIANNNHLFRSLNQANSDLQSISGNMQLVNESTKKVNQMVLEFTTQSKKTMETAKLGEEKIYLSIEAMQEIKDGAAKIQSVVTLITEISNKINLLALNASIEAARAGDAGRGFAVVAEEVSKLAVSTAFSIKEIKQLVYNSSEKTDRGVIEVSHVASLFKEIIQRITTLRNSTDLILTDLKEQSKSSSLVHKNISELSRFFKNIDETILKQQKVSQEMGERIAILRQSSEFISSGSAQIESKAKNLSRQSDFIKRNTEKFEL
jgi:methyl-accepting chemotaxis protein